MTALAFALCAAFIGLGHWQWERGKVREAQIQEFARGAERVLPLGSRSLSTIPRFQRVSATGRLDPRHQFLLDNRTYDGRAGYEVLTPLELSDGRILLVDRGWLPFSGYREHLPNVGFEAGAQRDVIGRVDELPSAGLPQGRSLPTAGTSWPKVTTYPTMAQLSLALGRPLESRILLLDPAAPDGYVRDWQAPGLSPLRHWSYAFQWWTFAAATIALWLVFSRARKSASP